MDGKRYGNIYFAIKLREIYLGEEFRAYKVDEKGERHLKLATVISRDFKFKMDDLAPYFKLFENSRMKNLIPGEEANIVNGRLVVLTPYKKEFRTLSEILEYSLKKNNGISLDNAVHILMSILDIALAFKQYYQENGKEPYFLPIPDDIGFNSEGAVFYRYPICNFLFGKGKGIEEVISKNFPFLFTLRKEISTKEEVYAFTSLFYLMLTGKRVNEISEDINTAYIASSKLSVPYDLYKTIPEFIVPKIEKGFSGDYINLHEMQKDFEEIIMDGEITPSTFNLAFYINSLFKEENKKELEEIKEEESAELPPDEIALAKEKEKEIEKDIFSTMEEIESKSGTKGIYIFIAIAVLIIANLLFVFLERKKKTIIVQKPTQQVNVEELAKKIEEKLSVKYEEKIKSIEEQYKQEIAKIKDEQKKKALLEERRRRIEALKKQQQEEKQKAVKQAIQLAKKNETKTPENNAGTVKDNKTNGTQKTTTPENKTGTTTENNLSPQTTNNQEATTVKKVEEKKQAPVQQKPVQTFKEGDIVPISTLDKSIKVIKQVNPLLSSDEWITTRKTVEVIMQVLINENGSVEKFRIIRVFPNVPNMKSRIKNVIYKWKFTKPTREGKKVKVWKTLYLAIKK